ncbi:hypothetical protein DAEQUDRAFT_770036 [Daedalea quercina L-15889]|uniref:Uncharacterized protein n=1 Tax=Daedalea quercina L-15889 TaxID=1314783 RepID=A0A165L843_9APHY|nr:hypothetical protein DAEQUDRAFT_770036 [Daedalea quercina L-15889]
MMTAACTNILTTEVGSANRPSSTLLKKSEVDWWVTFVDRPNDGEFEALKTKLPEVIEERCGIPSADILVEHMWTLTKMAIRNVPLSWKDPAGRKQIRDIGSLWHGLQKNARTDKATAAFLDVCIPFGNAPRAIIDEHAGTGQILHAQSSSYKPATPKRLVANAGVGAIWLPGATSPLLTAEDAVRSIPKSSTTSTRSVARELASPLVALPLRSAPRRTTIVPTARCRC